MSRAPSGRPSTSSSGGTIAFLILLFLAVAPRDLLVVLAFDCSAHVPDRPPIRRRGACHQGLAARFGEADVAASERLHRPAAPGSVLGQIAHFLAGAPGQARLFFPDSHGLSLPPLVRDALVSSHGLSWIIRPDPRCLTESGPHWPFSRFRVHPAVHAAQAPQRPRPPPEGPTSVGRL